MASRSDPPLDLEVFMSTPAPLRIAVVVGSTRPGRFAPTVADWFMSVASSRGDLELELLDLIDFELPRDFTLELNAAGRELVHRLEEADGFVVLTPEYNHSYPASLKQAIDLTGASWARKPVGFVCYGGLSGGLRAVEHLRPVFAEVRATTVRETVSLHLLPFDEEGRPHDPVGTERAVHTMLDDLTWWGRALRDARRREQGWHESGEAA